MTNYVEPEYPSSLIQNMVGFPAAVERYKLAQKEKTFDDEDPSIKDVNALAPTSGRKIWKLRHGKSLRKKIKKDKTGFIGA